MIEQGLFQKKIVGRDGFIWWIGQIASDSWKMNVVPSTPDHEDSSGFGWRYQVRILGYHTDSCEALSNDELPWASVMYPVTAGALSGSAGETPNLRKGNFVYGFFLDGEDAQQPVIMGVVGYNQYTSIVKNENKCMPFVPFLGYSKEGLVVPNYSIKSGYNKNNPCDTEKKEDGAADAGPKEGQWRAKKGGRGYYVYRGGKWQWAGSQQPSGTKFVPPKGSPTNLVQGGMDSQGNAAKKIEKEDGKKKKTLELPYSCNKSKSSTKGTQSKIQDLIQDIQAAKRSLKCFRQSLLSPSWSVIDGKRVDVDEYIRIKMERAVKLIVGSISKFITAIQDWIVQKIEKALLKIYTMLYPPVQQEVGDATRTAMDILACHFRKIINNLFKLVYQALTGILDKWINVPQCAAENFIASIMGKLMGLINGIVSQVTSIIDGVLGTIGAALDIVIDAFEFLDDILDFLLCKEDPECPKEEEWRLWLGSEPESTTIDVRNLLNKVKTFSGTVSNAVDPDNFDFDTDLDFSNIMEEAFDNCDTNPIQCGPPRAVFWGGSGNGASGNVIVSAIGDILGVDIINTGTGYDNRAPFLTFEDDCGNGNNGSGTVVTGPVSPGDDGTWFSDPNGTEIGVIGVNITDPGFDYLPVANGSQGGDGRTWATEDQTTVQHPDGTWDEPWDPEEIIPLQPGDLVRTPIGSKTLVYCMNGDTHEVFGGSPQEVVCEGVLTAPPAVDTAVPGGQYPAILYICEVDIINPGFGYNSWDEVVITPDVGAVILPTFGPFGNLMGLEIIDGGEGFTEFPTITIESETGFNAVIRARLCIDRVTDELKLPEVQDRVVQVVDCVGKI